MARPACLKGVTIKQKTACGNMYVTINEDANGKLMEVFCNIGKAGTCAKTWSEVAGRLLGEGIKKEVNIKRMVKALKGIRCASANEEVLSCPDAIAMALELYLNQQTGEK